MLFKLFEAPPQGIGVANPAVRWKHLTTHLTLDYEAVTLSCAAFLFLRAHYLPTNMRLDSIVKAELQLCIRCNSFLFVYNLHIRGHMISIIPFQESFIYFFTLFYSSYYFYLQHPHPGI